jgi:hypothetical protein
VRQFNMSERERVMNKRGERGEFDFTIAQDFGCIGCIFFHERANTKDSGKGDCREQSAKSNSTTTPFYGHWPTIRTDDWCGKHQWDEMSEARAKKYARKSMRLVVQNRHEPVSETVETDPEC